MGKDDLSVRTPAPAPAVWPAAAPAPSSPPPPAPTPPPAPATAPATPAQAGFDPTAASGQSHISEQGIPAATSARLGSGAMADSRTWVGRLPGNGGRPVAIIVPPGVDLSRPVQVITYFHGHNQSIARNILGDRPPSIRDSMMEVAERQNAIIIIPEGDFPGSPTMQPSGGANPTSLRMIQDGALQQVQRHWSSQPAQVSQWTLAGHSGGGRSMNEALSDSSPPERQPHIQEVYYLDATYANPPVRPGVEYHVVTVTGPTRAGADSLPQNGHVHRHDVPWLPHNHDGAATTGFRSIGDPTLFDAVRAQERSAGRLR